MAAMVVFFARVFVLMVLLRWAMITKGMIFDLIGSLLQNYRLIISPPYRNQSSDPKRIGDPLFGPCVSRSFPGTGVGGADRGRPPARHRRRGAVPTTAGRGSTASRGGFQPQRSADRTCLRVTAPSPSSLCKKSSNLGHRVLCSDYSAIMSQHPTVKEGRGCPHSVRMAAARHRKGAAQAFFS